MKPSTIRLVSISIFSSLLVTLVLLQLPTGAAQLQRWDSKVDQSVLNAASTGEAEFLIYMNSQADLSGAYQFNTKEEKARFVYEQLNATAQSTQPGVLGTLARLGAAHRGFWVTNAIWAKGDLAVVQAVAVLPEVAHVYASGGGRLKLPPVDQPLTSTRSVSSTNLANADPNPEANLTNVNADDVWALGVEGQGAVVAGADTGVFWQHAAIKRQYRGWNEASQTVDHSYNWHDSIHAQNTTCAGDTTAPCDDHDHGTHTVGTMVGDDGGNNRIGMAPEAKWIACRNMTEGAGVVPTYMECMQWFIAPTDVNDQNPDFSKAPDVINNSWGCYEGCPPPALQSTLRASRAAGIFYAVSAGNDGSSPLGVMNSGRVFCNTITTPLARYPEAFTVGSTDHRTDSVSYFSSRGSVLGDPAYPLGLMKPNISAPGSGIRSSIKNGSYASFSGTSMAGPHVAGLVALLISANPRLSGRVDVLENIIEQTAVRKFTNEGCGLDKPNTVPNNTYGWGRINALAAVLEALPPKANHDNATTFENTSVRIDVLANDTDPDGDPLTLTGVVQASHGWVMPQPDGSLLYIPASGFVGVDSFSYYICAPEGCDLSRMSATVTVNVVRG